MEKRASSSRTRHRPDDFSTSIESDVRLDSAREDEEHARYTAQMRERIRENELKKKTRSDAILPESDSDSASEETKRTTRLKNNLEDTGEKISNLKNKRSLPKTESVATETSKKKVRFLPLPGRSKRNDRDNDEKPRAKNRTRATAEENADRSKPISQQKKYYLDPTRSSSSSSSSIDDASNPYVNLEKSLHSMDYNYADMSRVIDMLGKDANSSPNANTYITPDRFDSGSRTEATVDTFTRLFEDGLLRTPRLSDPNDNSSQIGDTKGGENASCVIERECAKGDRCEGRNMLPNKGGDVLVGCLSLRELCEANKTGKPPISERLCILCRRYAAAYTFVNMRAELTNVGTNTLLSSHANIADKKGEYSLDHCLFTSSELQQGFPFPVVLHVRKYYKRSVQSDGTVYYLQKGYPFPEDIEKEFYSSELVPTRCSSSSSSPLNVLSFPSGNDGTADRPRHSIPTDNWRTRMEIGEGSERDGTGNAEHRLFP